MNSSEIRKQIGDIGEMLTVKYFEKKNMAPKLSEDYYDDEKDLTVNGNEKVEVKTMVPKAWFKHPDYSGFTEVFTIGENQMFKCENAEHLIFVQIPYFNENAVRIYRAKKVDGKLKLVRTNSSNGVRTIGLPIRECELLAEMQSPGGAEKLRTLSIALSGPKFLNAPPHQYIGEQ